ncbi:hypothetical protein VKT23_012183 [Stygiomarasmius scandens]|uniref:Uncharacterized protein n=1 Tax=Marasmiellus scandens TaxID=2682957 RepID=A0ABR1JAI1_9AGAR
MAQPIPAPKVDYQLGNHDLGALGKFRHRIVTDVGQTGDIPHIAATLVLDHLTDVIVLYKSSDKGTAQNAYDTYMNAIADEKRTDKDLVLNLKKAQVDRVMMIERPDTKRDYFGLLPSPSLFVGVSSWRSKSKATRDRFTGSLELWSYEAASGQRIEYPTISPVGATAYIAGQFHANPAEGLYSTLAARLSSRHVTPAAIEQWAKQNFEGALLLPASGTKPVDQKKLLLLWSRYSGQNKEFAVSGSGHNPENDSDPAGQKQIIQWGTKNGYIIVTISHDPSGWHKTPQDGHAKIHLGEFWNAEPFKAFGRPGQTSLYVALLRNYKIVQVGQKTGGMDNAALVGIPTVYIEDTVSLELSGGRMKRWSDEPKMLYKGAIITQPPGAFGKALRARYACYVEEGRTLSPEESLENRKEARKEAENGEFEAGYLPDDLESIGAILDEVYKQAYKA